MADVLSGQSGDAHVGVQAGGTVTEPMCIMAGNPEGRGEVRAAAAAFSQSLPLNRVVYNLQASHRCPASCTPAGVLRLSQHALPSRDAWSGSTQVVVRVHDACFTSGACTPPRGLEHQLLPCGWPDSQPAEQAVQGSCGHGWARAPIE